MCCHFPHIKHRTVRVVCSAEPLFHQSPMFSQRSPLFCWLQHITRSVFRELVWQQQWERKKTENQERTRGRGRKKQLPKKLKDKAWKRTGRRWKKGFALGLLWCWWVCADQLGGKNQRLLESGKYNINMVYKQQNINTVRAIQQTGCYKRETQPVGGLGICSWARLAIKRHFRYKFNH